jgi:cellobiose-specific phosphotransferase system component IIA
MSPSVIPWRQELFFKSHSQLQAIIPFLNSRSVKRVNIPNKNEADQLLDSVKALVSAGILDICVHYSIKNQPKEAGGPRRHYNPKTAVSEGHRQFMKFIRDLRDIEREAVKSGLDTGTTAQPAQQVPQLSILLVSGGGKKKAYNTVSALQEAQKELLKPDVETSEPTLSTAAAQQHQQQHSVPTGLKRTRSELLERPVIKSQDLPTNTMPAKIRNDAQVSTAAISGPCLIPILVAFNPYLPDPEDLQQEYQRLEQKLHSGVPTGVYLQVRP